VRYFYAVYAVITFVLLFLLFFPLFIVLSFFKAWGRKTIWRIIQLWSYIWFYLIAMPVRREYIQRPDRKKQYIVIANHWSYLDTAMIFRAIPFYARPLAKYELSKIPLFGFLYKTMAIIVDRENPESRLKSLHLLKHTIEAEKTSIFIFPEGTFNETNEPLKSFYDGAFRIAIETQTPILPVLFPDTRKRWHYRSFWAWSAGISRAVFLPEIDVRNYSTNDVAALRDKTHQAMWRALLDVD
jgi:1-acyl-sn-glycerol-3-phosphate acyltransferase